MANMRLIFGTFLLLFGVACQSVSQETGNAGATERRASDNGDAFNLLPTPEAPLFLVRTRQEIVGKGRRTRHTYLFLTAEGNVYKQYPRGEWVNDPMGDAMLQRDARNTGVWEKKDDRLVLEWPNESPPMDAWGLTPWENGYRRGQLGTYFPAIVPTNSTLVGHYVYQDPNQTDREIYAVPGFPQVTFFPDGRFSQNSRYAIMGQYQNTGDPAADEPYLSGTYRLNGYQLEIAFDNDLSRPLVAAFVPGEPNVLLIDGHRFVRYQAD